MRTWLTILGVAVLGWIFSSPLYAHTFMKKPFQKRYGLKLVSCNACHVKGEEKDVVNAFGETILKLLDGTDIVDRTRICKDMEKEAKQKVEKELAEEFAGLLKRLDKIKSPSGKPYGQAIPEGEVDGAKPRKRRAGTDEDVAQDETEESDDPHEKGEQPGG